MDHRALLQNYYDALGVSQTASADEITDAEIALRRLYETRSKQGDAAATDILWRLNEAQATLAVEHRRAEYDRRPSTIANAFADLAHSPQIARFDKLRAVSAWFDDGDPVRAATLIDAPLPHDLLKPNPLLDG